jgi:hypothetical protein
MPDSVDICFLEVNEYKHLGAVKDYSCGVSHKTHKYLTHKRNIRYAFPLSLSFLNFFA